MTLPAQFCGPNRCALRFDRVADGLLKPPKALQPMTACGSAAPIARQIGDWGGHQPSAFLQCLSYAQECAHAYHISGLLVKLLLSQAQANGLELQVDTHALESE